MRKALVFGAVVFLLFGGISYAIVAPFEVASLTIPNLPASASSYWESPQEIMQPIQKDINPQDTLEAVPYDDGITWSWEEKVTPIDVLEYVKDLPYNEWVEIDEKTTRQLFEGIIQKALEQMEIEYNGGEFEDVLRQKLLYFTPEYEYYWPPYEEDFSKRVVRWPVKIMRQDDSDNTIIFQLGRAYDDERKVEIGFKSLDGGTPILGQIVLNRRRYIPEEEGKPKKELLFLVWDKEGEVKFARAYLNNDGTIFKTIDRPILIFHQGNPAPVEDNTASEPPLEISGVKCLFDLKYRDYEGWDQHAFQTFRGLINLCKLQLNLQDNGHELEKILWRDFFIYKPDWNTGLGETALNLEVAGVERLNPPDENTEIFELTITPAQPNQPDKYIYITLTKEIGRYIPGYEWGVKHIRLEFATADENNIITGQEDRNFEFVYTMDYTEGIDPTEIAAYYDRYLFDTNGMLLTTPEEELIAAFYYNQPRPYVLSMRNK